MTTLNQLFQVAVNSNKIGDCAEYWSSFLWNNIRCMGSQDQDIDYWNTRHVVLVRYERRTNNIIS